MATAPLLGQHFPCHRGGGPKPGKKHSRGTTLASGQARQEHLDCPKSAKHKSKMKMSGEEKGSASCLSRCQGEVRERSASPLVRLWTPLCPASILFFPSTRKSLGIFPLDFGPAEVTGWAPVLESPGITPGGNDIATATKPSPARQCPCGSGYKEHPLPCSIVAACPGVLVLNRVSLAEGRID